MWKTVAYQGIDTKYEVSNTGEVRNKKTLQVLKPRLKKNGYLEYCIYPKPGQKTFLTGHKLVASAFIPNPDNLPTINHIDGNKQNNNVENLEWASFQENIQHAWNSGLASTTSLDKAVRQYTLNGTFVKEYKSCAEAVRETGIGHVHDAAKGTRNSAGGYYWEFVNYVPLKKTGNKIKIAQYDLNMNLIKIYESISKAAEESDINRVSINGCANGKQKTAGGFIWKKIQEDIVQ